MLLTYAVGMSFFDALFPRFCLECDALGSYLCARCRGMIVRDSGKRGFGEGLLVFSDYHDERLRKLIRRFKYSGVKELGEVLGAFLEVFVDKWQGRILVPVPLSKRKRRVRGFNQSRVLCDFFGGKGFEVWDCLERLHSDVDQVGLKRSQRVCNVRGKFYMKEGFEVCGKDFVLIDDVVTTGSTLRECRKVLLGAGARGVLAAVLARG